MILTKSDSQIAPSPLRSASSIISYSSSSVIFSPKSRATFFKCFKVIFSDSSSINNLKAFFISSTGSLSYILTVITSRKSLYSIVPEPLRSTSKIILRISSFLGSKPKALIATFNSLASIFPLPSVSNKSKASFISSFYSAVKLDLFFFAGYLLFIIILFNY